MRIFALCISSNVLFLSFHFFSSPPSSLPNIPKHVSTFSCHFTYPPCMCLSLHAMSIYWRLQNHPTNSINRAGWTDMNLSTVTAREITYIVMQREGPTLLCPLGFHCLKLSLITWTDPCFLLLPFDIFHFCAFARYLYSCDDSEITSQPCAHADFLVFCPFTIEHGA